MHIQLPQDNISGLISLLTQLSQFTLIQIGIYLSDHQIENFLKILKLFQLLILGQILRPPGSFKLNLTCYLALVVCRYIYIYTFTRYM